MHKARALLHRYSPRLFARLVKIGPVQTDLCPQCAHSFYLIPIGILSRAIDPNRHIEEMSGIGQRLTVVSGAGTDDAHRPLLHAQIPHQIDATPHLKSAYRLHILAFYVVLTAE